MLAMPGEPSWAWIVLQCLNQVIVRVLIVWVYVGSGGSLFAAIGFHALMNVSTLTLFPVYGSHYDPLMANVVLGVAALLVVRQWGSLPRVSFGQAIDRLRPTVGGERPAGQGHDAGYMALGLVLGPVAFIAMLLIPKPGSA